MLSGQVTITLTPALIGWSRRFADLVCAGYASGAKSAELAMNGVEVDPKVQAQARMAECAFCLWTGLDPAEALDWRELPDDGADVTYIGARIDVKSVAPGSKFLIWPKSKNHIFDSKRFDLFTLIRVAPPECTVMGWLTKAEFAAKKHVAPAGHKLEEGTWHVDGEEELHPASSLSTFLKLECAA